MLKFILILAAGAAGASSATAVLADCARQIEGVSLAYKAYNECSAAGRGGAGCAGESQAYDAARAQLDACEEQRRSSSRPGWESSPGNERDDSRPEPRRPSGGYRPSSSGPAGKFAR